MNLTLRREEAGDEEFIRRLVLDTVAAELGAAHWPEPMRSHLLGIQYSARRQSLRARFPEGESLIVLLGEEPAGWLYRADLEDELRLADIVLLPSHRGQGVGSALLREMLDAAARSGKPLRLTVAATNTGAMGFYEKLGFRRVGGTEVQHEMEARPST